MRKKVHATILILATILLIAIVTLCQPYFHKQYFETVDGRQGYLYHGKLYIYTTVYQK